MATNFSRVSEAAEHEQETSTAVYGEFVVTWVLFYLLSVELCLNPRNVLTNTNGVVLSLECRTFVERHFSSFTYLVCIVFGERPLICHSVLNSSQVGIY